jgi:cytochrome c-type biogenesis protein
VSAAAAFAFGAGLLATVNPCGFAMLPSFLSLYLGSSDSGERSALARGAQGFRVGLALTGGFAGVFVVAGLIISLGLRSFVHVIPWVALVVAAALVVLGAALLLGAHVGLTAASRVAVDGRGADGYRRVALFGAAYAFASLSCTLAVFLVVVSQAIAAANPIRVLAVFGAYAAGSATVLLALSLSVALAKAAVARAVRWIAPAVNRLAGALLLASGVYLVLYWLPLLGTGSASTSSAVRLTERLSSSLETFFAGHTSLFALALGVLGVTGVVVFTLASGREEPEVEREAGDACCAPEPDVRAQVVGQVLVGGRR